MHHRSDLEGWLTAIGISILAVSACRADTISFLVAERPGQEVHGDSYVLPLSNPDDVSHARRLISEGPDIGGAIAVAKIEKGADGVNRDLLAPGAPEWSWHVTEFSGFVDFTIEILDGWPGFVQQDVDAWIQNTGGSIGFWGYTVVAELSQAFALQAGDADQDLDFDQFDLVLVQQAAKYLTGEPATWGQGDWDGAPGGHPGAPPPGDGVFNQSDIVAALRGGFYQAGRYAANKPADVPNDQQTSILYDAGTGEIAVNAPASTQWTEINMDSVSGILTGKPFCFPPSLDCHHSDNRIFTTNFSGSFGNVAQAGLSKEFVLNDLTVSGSLASGGRLGDVDLIYIPVPEPSGLVLAVMGLLCVGVFTFPHPRCLGRNRAENTKVDTPQGN